MLILASNSPRRSQLLSLAGWQFTTCPAEIDERVLPGELPDTYVRRLAAEKAQVAADRLPDAHAPERLVVAADTAVVDWNEDLRGISYEILGKPVDSADAERMLRRLRGRVHKVLTGLAVLRPYDGEIQTDVCTTDVPMRDYTEAEMYAYIASHDPLDKAGAYAIQHQGFHPVQNLQGCYTNVVGLPLCHLSRMLASFNVSPSSDIGLACSAEFDYRCKIDGDILSGAFD